MKDITQQAQDVFLTSYKGNFLVATSEDHRATSNGRLFPHVISTSFILLYWRCSDVLLWQDVPVMISVFVILTCWRYDRIWLTTHALIVLPLWIRRVHFGTILANFKQKSLVIQFTRQVCFKVYDILTQLYLAHMLDTFFIFIFMNL